MFGISLALLAALSTSLQATFFKTVPHVDSWTVNWARFLIIVPILAGFVSIFSEWSIPPVPYFAILLLVSVPIELAIAHCLVCAYQSSPQSLVGPLSSLSIVFSIPVAFLLLGEVPSRDGAAGVALILIGALVLGWAGKFTVSSIAQKLIKERGTYYMLTFALLAAVSIPLVKYLFQYAPPLLSAFYLTSAVLAALTVRVVSLSSYKKLTRRDWKLIGYTSIFSGLTYVFHYLALSFIFAAYFVALKRMSIVFDVILGRTIYKEDDFLQRLLGAVVMIGGVALITIGIL